MKPYGMPKSKKAGPCNAHDHFHCWCDLAIKGKERANARQEIRRELKNLTHSDSSATHES